VRVQGFSFCVDLGGLNFESPSDQKAPRRGVSERRAFINFMQFAFQCYCVHGILRKEGAVDIAILTNGNQLEGKSLLGMGESFKIGTETQSRLASQDTCPCNHQRQRNGFLHVLRDVRQHHPPLLFQLCTTRVLFEKRGDHSHDLFSEGEL
jgi:hypothetical protein